MKVPFIGANTNPGVTEITNDGVLGYLFGQSESGTVQGEYTYAIPASLTKVEVTGTESSGYIPPGAFMNCANIVDILIDGGRNVCKNVFSNCRLLQNLYIPKSVANIDEGILEGCTNLETLTVPFIGTNKRDNKKETSVLGYFFGWSDTLLNNTDVRQEYAEGQSHFYHIPGTLKNVSVLSQTDIPYGAFMECYSLEQVSIVTGAVMNDMAFYNCTGLKKVTLPIDLLTIGYEAFAECESLESINLPNNTKTIGDGAVTITGSSTLKRGTLLLEAIYDADGVLKSVNTYNVPGLNIPIEVDTNYTETDEVKFMLWESLEGIKPVSDFIVI